MTRINVVQPGSGKRFEIDEASASFWAERGYFPVKNGVPVQSGKGSLKPRRAASTANK